MAAGGTRVAWCRFWSRAVRGLDEAGAEGGPPTAISPLQADADQVLFFVGVADVAATLDQAEKLGGTIVQPAQQVPGVTFGVLADPQGHQIGIAAQA
jgi:uncharacterized protein